jgi:predicted TIM-barrel fold metal-dependent hydrolase
MPVQVVCHMEDERTQHPMLRAAPVDLAPFPEVVKEIPKLRVQLLNCRGATPEVFTGLALTQQVFLDFAMIEGVHGVARLNVAIGSDRLVFGSYFPFFYFEAASLKIKEARLDPAALVANAKQLLGAAR